ncbi:MAG: hypothetical protein QNK11_00670 [Legionella sp.]|nr:hypothetical protein [Legionella sp.]
MPTLTKEQTLEMQANFTAKIDNYETIQNNTYTLSSNSDADVEQSEREDFINYMFTQAPSKTPENPIFLNNTPKARSITLEKLLGEAGVVLYQAALKEESESPLFQEACFQNSLVEIFGEVPEKPLDIVIGGPRTLQTPSAVSALLNTRYASETENAVHFRVTGDNVTEKTSQVRKLAMQLALWKGYSFISDLEAHSTVLESVEDAITQKSSQHALNTVRLETFASYGEDDLVQFGLKYNHKVKDNRVEPVYAVIEGSTKASIKAQYTDQFKNSNAIAWNPNAANLPELKQSDLQNYANSDTHSDSARYTILKNEGNTAYHILLNKDKAPEITSTSPEEAQKQADILRAIITDPLTHKCITEYNNNNPGELDNCFPTEKHLISDFKRGPNSLSGETANKIIDQGALNNLFKMTMMNRSPAETIHACRKLVNTLQEDDLKNNMDSTSAIKVLLDKAARCINTKDTFTLYKKELGVFVEAYEPNYSSTYNLFNSTLEKHKEDSDKQAEKAELKFDDVTSKLTLSTENVEKLEFENNTLKDQHEKLLNAKDSQHTKEIEKIAVENKSTHDTIKKQHDEENKLIEEQLRTALEEKTEATQKLEPLTQKVSTLEQTLDTAKKENLALENLRVSDQKKATERLIAEEEKSRTAQKETVEAAKQQLKAENSALQSKNKVVSLQEELDKAKKEIERLKQAKPNPEPLRANSPSSSSSSSRYGRQDSTRTSRASRNNFPKLDIDTNDLNNQLTAYLKERSQHGEYYKYGLFSWFTNYSFSHTQKKDAVAVLQDALNNGTPISNEDAEKHLPALKNGNLGVLLSEFIKQSQYDSVDELINACKDNSSANSPRN